MSSRKNKPFLNLVLVLVSIAVALVLLELAAGFFITRLASQEQFDKFASYSQLVERYGKPSLSKHRFLGYYLTPSWVREPDKHNSLGYRGEEVVVPKPDGVYRIVAIGGSTTYGGGVDDYRQAYPYLLQQYLNERGYENVEVVNAGVGGYRTWESLINLQFRVLDLEPDLIIIYHAINDIAPRLVWPPSEYRGDLSGYLDPPLIFRPSLIERSNLARMVMISLDLTQPAIALSRTWAPRTEFSYEALFEEQRSEGTYPQGIFLEVSAQEMLRQNPPIYFERNLRSMVAIARANGIEVILATFVYSPDFKYVQVSSPEYQSALAEHNDVIRLITASTEAHLFDFASLMPTNEKYFTDGVHFTFEGNQLRANLFADFIIESGFLDGITVLD